MAAKEALTSQSRFPWLTLAIASLATISLWAEPVSRALIYDRALIFNGQLWRLWTGHVVHFGVSHCLWNLAVVIPTGCWLERIEHGLTRWFYAVCPFVISVVLLIFDPSLAKYAGLSGLATGLLVLLPALQLSRGKEEARWFWASVLGLVALKSGVELFTGAPVFVSGFDEVRTVPLAHLCGAICAIGFWMMRSRSN